MSSSSHQPLALTNLVANRALIPILKSRAGRALGRRLAVVEYVGRRSGKPHRLVTLYATKGRAVRIRVGMAERKTWWRNFKEPQPVRLRLAGEDYHTTAHVVREGNLVSVVAHLGV
jgi:hypothetical protein